MLLRTVDNAVGGRLTYVPEDGEKVRVNGRIFHWDFIGSSAVSCWGGAVD